MYPPNAAVSAAAAVAATAVAVTVLWHCSAHTQQQVAARVDIHTRTAARRITKINANTN